MQHKTTGELRLWKLDGNGNRLTNMYAIDCTSNAIDFASLGEAFCLNPHGGAVANVGSTREDFPVTGRSYQDEFYRLVFDCLGG